MLLESDKQQESLSEWVHKQKQGSGLPLNFCCKTLTKVYGLRTWRNGNQMYFQVNDIKAENKFQADYKD